MKAAGECKHSCPPDFISSKVSLFFVPFCFPKKEPKRGPQPVTARLRMGTLIKLYCYCGARLLGLSCATLVLVLFGAAPFLALLDFGVVQL